MFETSDLYQLPESAKLGFIKALLAVANADGTIDLSESSFIQRVIESAEMSEDQLFEARKVLIDQPELGVILSDIAEESVGRLLVQQLVLLAHIDGEYHANEKTLIDSVASHFKFKKEWVEGVEAWAEDGMKWLQRGRHFIHTAEKDSHE